MDKKTTMELVSSWERKGIQQGMHDGKESLVFRLIRRRLGAVPAELMDRLGKLSSEQLDDLGEALLDFTSLADLEAWFSRH